MADRTGVDRTDAQLLAALDDDPRATVLALAERTGLSRNTVQARLTKLTERGVLLPFERRISPSALGYPLSAYILTSVTQRRMSAIAHELEKVPEVLAVSGLSAVTDLMIHVAAKDTDDLYRITGLILEIEGVVQTTTALSMRTFVEPRVMPLVERAVEDS